MSKTEKKIDKEVATESVEPKKKTANVIELECIKNTFLPDGTFVGVGSHIKVGVDYAEKVIVEKSSPFKLVKK
jgi:hypothetical protein